VLPGLGLESLGLGLGLAGCDLGLGLAVFKSWSWNGVMIF